MAFFDQAQEMLSQGIDTARGAVSGVAMEQLGFVRGFVRLCNDGWEQGWHERNGGNLSYRLRPEDVDTARKFFDKEPRPWTPLGVEAPTMGGQYFLVTGTGNYMRNVASDPSRNIGIVELSADRRCLPHRVGSRRRGTPHVRVPDPRHEPRRARRGHRRRLPRHLPRAPHQHHRAFLPAAAGRAHLHSRAVEGHDRVRRRVPGRCGRGAVDGARRRRHRPGHLRADEDLRRGGMGEPRPVRLRRRLR